MIAPVDWTVCSANDVANRQIDRLLLFTALQSGAWYAHPRARNVMPRVVKGAAVSTGLVAAAAMGAGVAGAAVARRCHQPHEADAG